MAHLVLKRLDRHLLVENRIRGRIAGNMTSFSHFVSENVGHPWIG